MEHRHGHVLREESKLQSGEMKFLRDKVEETRTNRSRNTHILGQLKMEAIQKQMKRSRCRWSGHVKKWISTKYQKYYWKRRQVEKDPGADHAHDG
jgi:hypothetical protein